MIRIYAQGGWVRDLVLMAGGGVVDTAAFLRMDVCDATMPVTHLLSNSVPARNLHQQISLFALPIVTTEWLYCCLQRQTVVTELGFPGFSVAI